MVAFLRRFKTSPHAEEERPGLLQSLGLPAAPEFPPSSPKGPSFVQLEAPMIPIQEAEARGVATLPRSEIDPFGILFRAKKIDPFFIEDWSDQPATLASYYHAKLCEGRTSNEQAILLIKYAVEAVALVESAQYVGIGPEIFPPLYFARRALWTVEMAGRVMDTQIRANPVFPSAVAPTVPLQTNVAGLGEFRPYGVFQGDPAILVPSGTPFSIRLLEGDSRGATPIPEEPFYLRGILEGYLCTL